MPLHSSSPQRGAGEEVELKGRYSTYALGELLGKGGSGVVYRATDRSTQQVVAVKKITTLGDEALLQCRNEVEALMSLRDDHGGGSNFVIRYLDHMQTAKSLFIVEEYAAGGSLLEHLKAHGQFEERTAARLMFQITSGLAYIHDRRIIHRDLKCANVLACGDGLVKLSDFGLSKMLQRPVVAAKEGEGAGDGVAGGEETATGDAVAGSVYWMSPEAFRGEAGHPSSDIWSLGCLCVELLTGRPPLYNRSLPNAMYYTAVNDEAVPLPEMAISEDGKNFIVSCLARDPNKRPTARELLRKAPWFTDARVRLRLDAMVERGAEGAEGAASVAGDGEGADDSVGQWVASQLYTATEEQRGVWLDEGNLERVVSLFPLLTAEEVHASVHTFAFAAERWGAAFVNYLGDAPLWSFHNLALTSQMPANASRVFMKCCACQDPAVPHFAPSHPRALAFFLTSQTEAIALGCVRALEALYVNDARTPADRRSAALGRLVADGGLRVIRAVVEEACGAAFEVDAAPAIGWDAVERLCRILLAADSAPGAAAVLWNRRLAMSCRPSDRQPQWGGSGRSTAAGDTGALERVLAAAEQPAMPWYLAIQEAARKACPAAAELCVRLVSNLAQAALEEQQQQPSSSSSPLVDGGSFDGEGGGGGGGVGTDAARAPGYLEVAGVSLAGVLLLLAVNTALPDGTRVQAVQSLAVLSRCSLRARAFFADEHRAIPHYAYLLRRTPAPQAGGRRETLLALLALCEEQRVAAACAGSKLLSRAVAQLLCSTLESTAVDDDDDDDDSADAALCLQVVQRLSGTHRSEGGAVEAVAQELADRPEVLAVYESLAVAEELQAELGGVLAAVQRALEVEMGSGGPTAARRHGDSAPADAAAPAAVANGYA